MPTYITSAFTVVVISYYLSGSNVVRINDALLGPRSELRLCECIKRTYKLRKRGRRYVGHTGRSDVHALLLFRSPSAVVTLLYEHRVFKYKRIQYTISFYTLTCKSAGN